MSTGVTIPFPLPRSGWRGTEFYRLVRSPYLQREALLEDFGGRRGRELALAVGGTAPRKGPGLRLSPARCIKWVALFHAGFSAILTEGGWRYRVNGCPLVDLSEAVRTARALQT